MLAAADDESYAFILSAAATLMRYITIPMASRFDDGEEAETRDHGRASRRLWIRIADFAAASGFLLRPRFIAIRIYSLRASAPASACVEQFPDCR